MILKSFGCSFIFGTDLADVNSSLGEPWAKSSKFTWPSLLAASNGYDYKCYARPGSGNLRILEKVLSHAADPTPCVMVIGWTWIDRFDYTVDLPAKYHVYDQAGANLWQTIMPVDDNSRAHYYYRDLHSQFRDKLTNLLYVKTAIDILKQKNIPFVMTYIDDLLFETQWHTTSAILELQEYVRPHLTLLEGKTFLEFSKEKGFSISKTLHPLEDAHQAAFELIKSYNLV